MTCFEEFLKTRLHLVLECAGCGEILDTSPIIRVNDLGEWAWGKWKESFYFEDEVEWTLVYFKATEKEKKEMEQIENEEPPDGNFHLSNMAIACLGKAEIEKRLKELGKT